MSSTEKRTEERPMFDFHMVAIDADRSGYYFPRWDRATPITVRAATQQEAVDQADAALGPCPRGRGWQWKFRVKSIVAAAVGGAE